MDASIRRVMAATERKRRPLIEGRRMICPRCKTWHDILQYRPMQVIDEYVHATCPIYICPACRWKFAPAPDILTDVVTTAESYQGAYG